MLEEVRYLQNYLEAGPVPGADFKMSVGWVAGGGKSRKGTGKGQKDTDKPEP